MAVAVPKEMSFYSASENEPEYVLLWIPKQILKEMSETGKIRKDAIQYYPEGLELEVDAELFKYECIEVGISPELIVKTYYGLQAKGKIDKSGFIKAEDLFQAAKKQIHHSNKNKGTTSSLKALCVQFISFPFRAKFIYPAPQMTEGETPEEIFNILKQE